MKKIILPVFLLLFFFVFVSKVNAMLTSPEYYNSSTAIPYTYACTFPCGALTTTCWNGQTPGVQTSCGNACEQSTNSLALSQSWTKYVLSNTTCYTNYNVDPTGNTCTPVYVVSGQTCSTADKYNGSPDFPSGDLTEARYGSCDCSAGNIFKTCCNGTSPYDTYNYTAATGQGNPNHPDAACAGTSFPQCGSAGLPACGAAACAGPPTPTPQTTITYTCNQNAQCVQITNGQPINGQYANDPTCGGTNCNSTCPNYAPPPTQTSGSCPYGTTCVAQQPSETVQTSCTPTGFQCSPACSFTCIDSQGNTCPATSCSTVWACQGGTQWYNGGQYYYTCPASCPNCSIGATKTICGPTSVCHAQ